MVQATRESLGWPAGLVALVVVLSGCGVADGLDRLSETIDETLEDGDPASIPASGVAATGTARVEWSEYAGDSGFFTVDLPAEPDYQQTEQDGLTVNAWSTEAHSDGYVIGEIRLGTLDAYDFDLGVLGTVDGLVNSIEDQLDRPTAYEMIEQSADVRDGHDGVRFAASITMEDDEYATAHGAIYRLEEAVVILTVVDTGSDHAADADRFIESLRLSP